MDVDIDLPTSFDPLDYFPTAIRASRVFNKDLAKHPSGVYLRQIPTDPVTRLAAIPFSPAEDEGYFKFDFLHLSLLDVFDSKEQIRALSKAEPDWTLLWSAEHVSKLFQIHKHHELIFRVKPSSIQELADCIALIRPGKRHLLEAYVEDQDAIRPAIYTKPKNNKYHFKRAHAISYAVTIVLQLHLIKADLL